MIAMKKPGTLTLKNATSRVALSVSPSLFCAAMTPSGIPMTTVRNIDTVMSSSVAGR